MRGDFCCDVDRPQRKDTSDHFRHFRVSLFFASLGERDSPTCCEPQTLFTQDPTIDNSCEESDASYKERNSLIFFTLLNMVRTVSLVNRRQT